MLKRVLRSLKLSSSGGRTEPRPFRYAILEHISGRRTFVKTYPAHVRTEFIRAKALYEIGKRTGLFRAPQPLHLVEAENIIIWEHLEGLVELRDHLLADRQRTQHGSSADRAKLFFHAGRVLAAIHEGFQQMETTGEYSPIPCTSTGDAQLDRHIAEVLGNCTKRPIHWDYCCGNLFTLASNDGAAPTLVVLDAMPNHYVLQNCDPQVACPIYVDVAQMIFSIYCHPVFSRSIAAEAQAYIDQFLDGYGSESGAVLDRPAALGLAAELTRIYQEFRARSEDQSSGAAKMDRRFRETQAAALIEAAQVALSNQQTGEPRPSRVTVSSAR